MTWTAKTTGPDALGLCRLLEHFAAEQSFPDHLDKAEAAALMIALFRRRLLAVTGADFLYQALRRCGLGNW